MRTGNNRRKHAKLELKPNAREGVVSLVFLLPKKRRCPWREKQYCSLSFRWSLSQEKTTVFVSVVSVSGKHARHAQLSPWLIRERVKYIEFVSVADPFWIKSLGVLYLNESCVTNLLTLFSFLSFNESTMKMKECDEDKITRSRGIIQCKCFEQSFI